MLSLYLDNFSLRLDKPDLGAQGLKSNVYISKFYISYLTISECPLINLEVDNYSHAEIFPIFDQWPQILASCIVKRDPQPDFAILLDVYLRRLLVSKSTELCLLTLLKS